MQYDDEDEVRNLQRMRESRVPNVPNQTIYLDAISAQAQQMVGGR